MKPLEDAHGRMMYDQYKGIEANEIVERDDGFVQSLPATGYFEDYRKWPQRYKNSMKYVRGKVLDVGCGAGRHSLYLQRKGFDVLGIDISPYAVKTTKLRGLKKAKVIPFIEVSSKLGTFDTVLMMGNNFGLFEGPRQAKHHLKKLLGMTSPNARIIAETRDPYKTDDPAHLRYHELNRRKGRMPGQLRIRVRYREYSTPWFEYFLASKQELERILKGTGWKVKRIINHSSPMYVAIIEKTEVRVKKSKYPLYRSEDLLGSIHYSM